MLLFEAKVKLRMLFFKLFKLDIVTLISNSFFFALCPGNRFKAVRSFIYSQNSMLMIKRIGNKAG